MGHLRILVLAFLAAAYEFFYCYIFCDIFELDCFSQKNFFLVNCKYLERMSLNLVGDYDSDGSDTSAASDGFFNSSNRVRFFDLFQKLTI